MAEVSQGVSSSLDNLQAVRDLLVVISHSPPVLTTPESIESSREGWNDK